MSAERPLIQPHILTVFLEPDHEDCYQEFLRDPTSRERCGSYNSFSCYGYSLVCPKDDPNRTCHLWYECDHPNPIDDETFPCLREAAGEQMCIAFDDQCVNCLKAAVVEDEWYDTHPHGAFEKTDSCWAQYALGETGLESLWKVPTVALDDTYIGRWVVFPDNTGGFEEMDLFFDVVERPTA